MSERLSTLGCPSISESSDSLKVGSDGSDVGMGGVWTVSHLELIPLGVVEGHVQSCGPVRSRGERYKPSNILEREPITE